MGYKIATRSKSNPIAQDQRTLTMFEEFDQIIKKGTKRNADTVNDSPLKVNKKPKKESQDQKAVLDAITSIKEEIQSWSIPALVAREQFMTDCWMKNSMALVKNAKLAASMAVKVNPKEGEIFKNEIEQKVQEPALNSLLNFWSHPSSAPLWKTSRLLQIHPNDAIWVNWWDKIQNDYKGINPQYKLEKYLTGLDYFNHLMVKFWSQMAYNITSQTQEDIVADLTRLGDFLKLSGLEITLVDQLYQVAENIAINKPVVGEIRKKLEKLWPTGMNIASFHYNEPKFTKVILDQCIDQIDAKATAKLKHFRFEPEVAWKLEEDQQESTFNMSNQLPSHTSTPIKNSLDIIEAAGPSGIKKQMPYFHKLLAELDEVSRVI